MMLDLLKVSFTFLIVLFLLRKKLRIGYVMLTASAVLFLVVVLRIELHSALLFIIVFFSFFTDTRRKIFFGSLSMDLCPIPFFNLRCDAL